MVARMKDVIRFNSQPWWHGLVLLACWTASFAGLIGVIWLTKTQ